MFHALPVLPLALTLAAAQAPPGDPFAKDIRPILTKFCGACHGPAKKKGGLDLSPFKTEADAAKEPALWADVMERVQAFEMPPPGAREVPFNENRTLLRWLRGVARKETNCQTVASDRTQRDYRGHVMSRRLTRAEYDNTVRDLVGLDLKPSAAFPTDGSGGEGFDTDGAALFTSAIHVEQYLAAADRILDAALKDPAARKRLLVAEPGKDLPPRDAAKRVVRGFADRAYRRPLEDAEVDRLLTVFDAATARGEPFEAALRQPLKAVLISPYFLFLVEPEADQEGVFPLAHYPLASRLSYFLWATMPDDELFALARQGKLHDDEVLRQQVRRILKDPKARGFAESFAPQWLGLRPLGETTRPDPKKFPEFDDALADAMRREVLLLVEHVIREDRSLLELIDADYTFANDRLAKHYGLPGVTGPGLRKVKLPDRSRGGVLTTAAALTVTSYPLRTSPVLRGRWVLEEVLGSKVPPPPPDVPELPKDDSPAAGLSFRKQLEAHRKNPECASCHARMDPLGFGLENFDPLGRWRTAVGGGPVDAGGELPSGEKFSGPAELKDVLLKRKAEFLTALGRKLFGYALGRRLYAFDQCVIDDAVKALAESGYRSSVLVERIVLSYPFRHRYVKK
jgi:hypothetical protein